MHKTIVVILCAGSLAISACEMTPGEQAALGGFAGAAAGAITAKALDLDDDWVILAALGGAAAGTLVARNSAKNQCAYSNGDGTYRTGPCP